MTSALRGTFSPPTVALGVFAATAMLLGTALVSGLIPLGGDDEQGPQASASPSAAPIVYPNEASTGVPPGTSLTSSGSLTITQPGTVVDGLEITGTVIVEADDVTIRNTRILNTGAYPVRISGSKNLVIEDSEIDGQGNGYAAVAFSNYTLRRVNIHHVTEGPRIAGSNVTIEDSYIHHLVQKDDNHTDVVQALSGKSIVLRGNNLQAYNPDTGSYGNAAFMFGEEDGLLRDCIVERNLMNGGNVTVNGGGGGTDGAECTFRANQFGRDFRYDSHANLGDNVEWESSNTWLDTGLPVG